MNHINIIKLLLLLICVFVNTNIKAQNVFVDVNNIKYTSGTNTSTTVIVISNSYSGDIVIPASVTYEGTQYTVVRLGYQSFFDCNNLTSITIPNSVTELGDYALYNCYTLTSFTSFNPEPPTTGISCFDLINFSNCNLYVPVGSKSKYAAAAGWSQFTNIIEFDPTSVEYISNKSVKVYAESDNVVIKDAFLGESIKIFTVNGTQINSIQAQKNIIKYKLPANQIYIIQIGQTSRKVAL